MAFVRDKRVDGEYDRPLPERKAKPTKADQKKLKKLLKKYEKRAP